MDDKEKITAAVAMLRQLKRMVGFFMKKEISDLIVKLEAPGKVNPVQQSQKLES